MAKSKAAESAAMNGTGSRAAARAAEKEQDFTTWAAKEPTDLQGRFADWLIEKVGVAVTSKKEEAAFREGVRLGTALRIPFQASPENQAARASKAAEPKPAKVAKAAAAPAKKATAKAEVATEETAEAAPAKGPRRAPRKAAPSAATPF